jgi:hypothetical protein
MRRRVVAMASEAATLDGELECGLPKSVAVSMWCAEAICSGVLSAAPALSRYTSSRAAIAVREILARFSFLF